MIKFFIILILIFEVGSHEEVEKSKENKAGGSVLFGVFNRRGKSDDEEVCEDEKGSINDERINKGKKII